MKDHRMNREVAPGPTALGRRLGPVVALVGVLGALSVTAWVALAPDNVVGPVTEAPFELGATMVLDGDRDGCIGLVEADARRRELCIEGADAPEPDVWFDEQARLVARLAGGGTAVVDLDTGATTPVAVDEAVDRSVEDAHTDGGVVRSGACCGGDGEVLLDLGGPVADLRSSTLAPDRRLVVARDRRDRVLVADPARPAEVHEWFVLGDEEWVDLDRAVGWTG